MPEEINTPDGEYPEDRDFVQGTTSASALDCDKGKALDPRKMRTHFSASKPMQSIGVLPRKNNHHIER